MSQFGSLDEMQREMASLPVRFFGVNQNGDGGLNLDITVGRTIPWLQDELHEATDLWHAQHFDLFVLDQSNAPTTVINLTDLDLTDPANREELRSIVVEALER